MKIGNGGLHTATLCHFELPIILSVMLAKRPLWQVDLDTALIKIIGMVCKTKGHIKLIVESMDHQCGGI